MYGPRTVALADLKRVVFAAISYILTSAYASERKRGNELAAMLRPGRASAARGRWEREARGGQVALVRLAGTPRHKRARGRPATTPARLPAPLAREAPHACLGPAAGLGKARHRADGNEQIVSSGVAKIKRVGYGKIASRRSAAQGPGRGREDSTVRGAAARRAGQASARAGARHWPGQGSGRGPASKVRKSPE